MDISLATAKPIKVLESLQRSERILEGGQLTLYNNSSQSHADLIFKKVKYQEGCCYPSDGKVEVSFNGNLQGKGIVKFTSCGSATVTKDNRKYDLTFYTCE